jgi:hypothetical protein
MTVDRVR